VQRDHPNSLPEPRRKQNPYANPNTDSEISLHKSNHFKGTACPGQPVGQMLTG
jgi:hypothetical protein